MSKNIGKSMPKKIGFILALLLVWMSIVFLIDFYFSKPARVVVAQLAPPAAAYLDSFGRLEKKYLLEKNNLSYLLQTRTINNATFPCAFTSTNENNAARKLSEVDVFIEVSPRVQSVTLKYFSDHPDAERCVQNLINDVSKEYQDLISKQLAVLVLRKEVLDDGIRQAKNMGPSVRDQNIRLETFIDYSKLLNEASMVELLMAETTNLKIDSISVIAENRAPFRKYIVAFFLFLVVASFLAVYLRINSFRH
ncbi:hypothetical protein LH452_11440 [Laribacter hongkongensis]|uniref:hypothetical protein n=1 Tax=Laribacter hongkongensis TaxID=168471 RepID=UPI001EFD9345|nr:hypothetical protein [Laribacter hongkongensis]MCG9059540.1 hypothetical protein [Laribacter hongkongensis]MCG9086578.1 hypothetical protein [Laribacter hongkongensis]